MRAPAGEKMGKAVPLDNSVSWGSIPKKMGVVENLGFGEIIYFTCDHNMI
jgi:hypothetical protein